ncbi:MAG: Ig-like domain-containing protein, partial [Clostridia bacterium]|nr:Ig-like domain-containing protein [Clostridia bacterium]
HDFDGYRVENLDDQEDTNFVVYAQGVQELTATATSNVLQGVDENTLTYTFKNPDASMKALQLGDVFYVPVSESNLEASAVKVKTIQVIGDTAIIQSDTVSLEDLFVYIDLDVYLDPTQAYQANDDARATRSAAFKSLLEGEKDTTLSDINFGRYVNFALGTGSNGLGSSMDLGCDFCGTLRNTRVQLRYSVWDKYFSYDVSTRLVLDVQTTLDCSGVIKADKDLPLLKIPLGLTGFAFGLQAVGGVNLSATASGQWDVLYEYDLGASYYPDKGMNTYFTPVSKSNDGELSFEGSFELSVGIKATFGIPEVVNAYIQGDAGWELTGEFAEIEGEGSGADCIHGCEKCIDGDVNFFVRASAGISADILKETVNIDLGLKRDIAEKKWKLGDFYCSFIEGYFLPSFDWKECPFKRWKVEVKVKDEDGNPVNDAEVYYTDTNGIPGVKITDAQGVATFYVRNGTYTIECIYEAKEYDKEVTVLEKPTSVIFILEHEKKITVVYGFGEVEIPT